MFELLVFIVQKGVVSFQNIVKHIFLAFIAKHENMEKWSIFNLCFCPKKNCYPVCFFSNIFIRDCLLIFFIEKIAFQTRKRDFLEINEKSKFFKGVCLWFLKKNLNSYLMRFLGEINQKILVCLQSLQKRILFRQTSIDLLSSCLFRSKNTQEKNFHFAYQPWTNPFKKFPYFYLFYKLIFLV